MTNTQPPTKKDEKPKLKRQKKIKRLITKGRAYITATYNNTIVTITDEKGDALAWSGAGVVGFKGTKKSTPYAASIVVRDVLEKCEPIGLKEVAIFVRGIGQGRESAIRAFHTHGVHIRSIKDITPVPHNGCRPPKTRRI